VVTAGAYDLFTLDFGDAKEWNKVPDLSRADALPKAGSVGTWGVSSKVKEGGNTGVTVYYQPPAMPIRAGQSYTESGLKDIKLQKSKITEVNWRNVPK